MYVLRVEDEFDAAHFLPWHSGKCQEVHGHRWKVRVTIEARGLGENGIIVDFGKIKALLPDHRFLNEKAYLESVIGEAVATEDWIANPTAENIADKLFKEIMVLLDEEDVDWVSLSVRVWESPGCSVERVSESTTAG